VKQTGRRREADRKEEGRRREGGRRGEGRREEAISAWLRIRLGSIPPKKKHVCVCVCVLRSSKETLPESSNFQFGAVGISLVFNLRPS